ncbi:transposable element tc3 transposase [Plakobranchus ocellatus]|uniref:Transposable element tc3 transposase n=1 Tax=Plakobranchus ocellatus TaxID=259542 RepID=A0AAV4B6V2_9GAST|nr:transposable element tc3 transposase [Plakobranchus ocellatus]
MISLGEDAFLIRERDIPATQQCQTTLSRGSETIIFPAPSRHAYIAKSYNFCNAQKIKILRKRLRYKLYKLQLVQKLYPRDKEARFELYHIVQEPMENNPDLLSKIIFSDEATFHLSGDEQTQCENMQDPESLCHS